MVLLDTCFIIDIIRNNSEAVDCLGRLLINTEPMLISSTTVFELHHGISRSQRKESEHQRVEAVLTDVGVINMDSKIAASAGRLSGESHNQGRPIPSLDCIIAATALETGEELLTRNTKHFDDIEGLKTRSW